MAEPGKVGVVTVTYNSEAVIGPFVECLLRQTYPDLVLYVVDNCSTDKTLDQLNAQQDERIQVIRNSENVGVAAGNNLGIAAALDEKCDYVLLLNNDTEFAETLVEELIAGIRRHECDMTTAKIVYFDEPSRIWSAGGTFLPWAANRSKHYGLDQIDSGQFSCARRLEYTPTCCLLVHRRVFEAVGLMDEKFFVYVDDTDFLFRAMRAGLVLYFLPSAIVKHKIGSLTGGCESAFSIRLSVRNKVYFIRKHYARWQALFWLALYQLHLAGRLVLRKDSVDLWHLKQGAFREGIQMEGPRSVSVEEQENSFVLPHNS